MMIIMSVSNVRWKSRLLSISIVDVNITNIRILNRCSLRTQPTIDIDTQIFDKSYVGCFTT